jgi:hypothetical protein
MSAPLVRGHLGSMVFAGFLLLNERGTVVYSDRERQSVVSFARRKIMGLARLTGGHRSRPLEIPVAHPEGRSKEDVFGHVRCWFEGHAPSAPWPTCRPDGPGWLSAGLVMVGGWSQTGRAAAA